MPNWNSLRGRSHAHAVERFAEQTEKFSSELAKRSAVVRSIGRTGTEDDAVVAERALRELREQYEELVTADEHMHAQVDELKRAVTTAEYELRRHRDLFDSVRDALLVLSPSGVVEEANRAALDLFAIKLPWLQGKPLSILLDSVGKRRLFGALEKLRTSAVVAFTMTVRRLDGVHVPVTSTCSHIQDGTRILLSSEPAGPPSELTVSETALRVAELESALRDRDVLLAHERAEHQRLAEQRRALERFLALLSHDLRGPIHAVLGWADVLARETLAKVARDRAVATITRNARIQLALVEQLLDVSRLAADKLALQLCPVDAAALVARISESFLPNSKAAGVTLTFDVSTPEPAVIFADRLRIEQVLTNLLSNAVKFTPSGGHVGVTLSTDGDHVVIRVSDDGRGIDASDLPTLFECFGQAYPEDPNLGGLGLGLYIAKQVVALHGGSLEAESDGSGRGATFVIRLSAHRAVAPAERPSTREPLRGLEGLRILLVEDDDDARDLLATLLTESGASIGGARDAASALALFRSFKPDLLVSDIGLPGEDGCSLIRSLRQIAPQLPAIAVTGFARPEDVSRALHAGFNAHLSKPLVASALLNAISDAVSHAPIAPAEPNAWSPRLTEEA